MAAGAADTDTLQLQYRATRSLGQDTPHHFSTAIALFKSGDGCSNAPKLAVSNQFSNGAQAEDDSRLAAIRTVHRHEKDTTTGIQCLSTARASPGPDPYRPPS